MNKKIIQILVIMLLSVSCSDSYISSREMIEVGGGSFIMGNESTSNNIPHKVTLDTFFMAKYLVTVDDFKIFLAETELPFDWDWTEWTIEPNKLNDFLPTDDCPAQGFNWYYAVAYCNWLSRREKLTPCYIVKGEIKDNKSMPEVIWNKKANGYRLPTEAEWEYAARGGQLSKGYLYAGSNNPDEIGLFRQQTSYPVGKMKPNELGLHDMTANVVIWCWDWFYENPGAVLPEKNPSVDSWSDVKNFYSRGLNRNPVKVLRGSRWSLSPFNVFSRSHYPPQYIAWIGIRLVKSKI